MKVTKAVLPTKPIVKSARRYRAVYMDMMMICGLHQLLNLINPVNPAANHAQLLALSGLIASKRKGKYKYSLCVRK